MIVVDGFSLGLIFFSRYPASARQSCRKSLVCFKRFEMASGHMSTFIDEFPQMFDVILILSALTKRFELDQPFGRNNRSFALIPS